jgi:hypothetical protein
MKALKNSLHSCLNLGKLIVCNISRIVCILVACTLSEISYMCYEFLTKVRTITS